MAFGATLVGGTDWSGEPSAPRHQEQLAVTSVLVSTTHTASPEAVAAIAGRRVPIQLQMAQLQSPALAEAAVPLPVANTFAHIHFAQRRLGRLESAGGRVRLFNPESVLVKFRISPLVAALRVPAGRELEAVQLLAGRADVEFAELDCLQQRAFVPNDPLVTNQWHHAVIGSYAAWEKFVGSGTVRVAIVDTPFQMDHPDLAAHVAAGWDAVANVPVPPRAVAAVNPATSTSQS